MPYSFISTLLVALLGGATLVAGLSGWKNDILRKHNDLRSKVASGRAVSGAGTMPRASNLRAMSWDRGLASSSQSWANRCKFEHSDGKYGENIAYTAGDPAKKHAQMWEDEIKQYYANPTKPYNFDWKTGHFTQMIWASTTKVGCGLAKCDNFFKGATFLVCRYSPPGNYQDKPVYKS